MFKIPVCVSKLPRKVSRDKTWTPFQFRSERESAEPLLVTNAASNTQSPDQGQADAAFRSSDVLSRKNKKTRRCLILHGCDDPVDAVLVTMPTTSRNALILSDSAELEWH